MKEAVKLHMVCIFMYTYINTYICTYAHTYICTYRYTHTHTHTYTYTHAHPWDFVYTRGDTKRISFNVSYGTNCSNICIV